MKNRLLLFIFLFFLKATFAQVSFSNEGSLLGNITNLGYQDCSVDMNGDYLDDVVRVTDNGIYIDYQQEDGSFTQTFFEMAIQNPPNWSICAGDIDKNGFTDLLFGNGSRVSFCYANADGTAYTEDPRPEYIFSQRSTFADIDNNGHLDAFVCHDVDQSHPYRNDGSGNLVLDQTLIETLDVGGNYAAIWVDYDNDWDIDLYITKCRGGAPVGDPQRINLMYRNNGDGSFSEIGTEINMDDGEQSWTTVFEDFDNDGDFDAFIVNHTGANKLMENNGSGMYTDVISGSGINATDLGAWDCDAGDFNNDGFVDIFSELQSELYLNNGDMTFTPQELPFKNGGIGDFNDDGFLDVIQDNNLWINQTNTNNWIKVGCEGVLSNINGIGARIEIYGEWGVQIREIRAGESFRPMSSLVEHFGIGQASVVDQMIIKWPSGVVTIVENPAINATYIIPEVGCIADANEITVNGSTEICPGDSVELIADEALSYYWSNGDTTQSIYATAAGTYTVNLLTEDSCNSFSTPLVINALSDQEPYVIYENEPLLCEGESFMLTSSESTGNLWNTGETTSSIEVTETGFYEVSVEGICSGETQTSEGVEVTFIPLPAAPEIENIELNEPGEAIFTASSDNVLWYDAEDAIIPGGEGNTYSVPFVENQVSVWAESYVGDGVDEVYGGKEDNSGGGGISAAPGRLIFDVYEDIHLKEFTVYAVDNSQSGPGERTFVIYDTDENSIATILRNLEIGPNIVDVDVLIPAGTNYSIGCLEANIYRNNNSVNFPYPLGDLGSINTTSNGSDFYYYFYNWKVSTPGVSCYSERVEATATVVGIDELALVRKAMIYPNPAQGKINLQLNLSQAQSGTIQIFTLDGKQVLNRSDVPFFTGEQELIFDAAGWPSGFYNLRIRIENEQLNLPFILE